VSFRRLVLGMWVGLFIASWASADHTPQIVVSTDVIDSCYQFPEYNDRLLYFQFTDSSNQYGAWYVRTAYQRVETVRERVLDSVARRIVDTKIYTRRIILGPQMFSTARPCIAKWDPPGCYSEGVDEVRKRLARLEYEQFQAQYKDNLCPQ